MAFPYAAGTVSYSGTTVSNATFIPEIWSGKLIEKYYDATVLTVISNTNYEGEIRNMGDRVHIRTVPTLQINDYVSGQTLTNQRPTSTMVDLTIDKGKYWSAIIDDVQDVQADMNLMNMWAEDAAEQMKISVDTDVLAPIFADFAANNKGATAGRLSANINLGTTGAPVGLTKTNILDYIIDVGQVLDENLVPETGRFFVMPVWATALLKKSDLKDASLTGDGTSVLRNGRLGMIDRFTIYSSNLLPRAVDGAVTAYHFYAGYKSGLTFASQLVKTEKIRAESTFGDIMRGLQVFGFKVIDGTMLADLYAYKA